MGISSKFDKAIVVNDKMKADGVPQSDRIDYLRNQGIDLDLFNKYAGAIKSKGADLPVSKVQSALQGAFQGATMGFGDELVAAVSPLTRQQTREESSRIRQANPTTAFAGDIGGSVLLASVLKPLSSVIPAARGGSLGLKAARGLGIGSALGAVEGAGRAKEGEKVQGAKTGAVIGGTTGGLLPVAGAGTRKLKSVVSSKVRAAAIPKGRGSILNMAKNKPATEAGEKAFRSSKKLSEQYAPEVKEALINTEDRTRKILNRGLGSKNIKSGFQNVKDEFSTAIEAKNVKGLKNIPQKRFNQINTDDEIGDIFKKAQRLARRQNPELAGLKDNSIRVMQDTKSVLGKIERKGGIDSVTAGQVKRDIGSAIEDKISGFKDLTTKYAKSIQADELLEDINNLKGQEISDFARKLTTSQSKKKITGLVGESKGNQLISALRKESDRFDNLKKLGKAIDTGETPFVDKVLSSPLSSGRAVKDLLEGSVQANTGKRLLGDKVDSSLQRALSKAGKIKPSELQKIMAIQPLIQGE